MMNRYTFTLAFAMGALVVFWVMAAVAHSHLLVLFMCLVIALVYGFGAKELFRYRKNTSALQESLENLPDTLLSLSDWLNTLPSEMQNPVRLRIEGERIPLPGPALTPYLVGLLVMLGMLGTFLGMVVTLNGAVFALQASTDISGIRAAFSEPMKGLGLAFGTSVAGVATSAMLGLMSSLVRRDRAGVGQLLDFQIADRLRHFTLAFQRQETFSALQNQTRVLPEMMRQLQDTLHAMMTQMEQSSVMVNERLLANQSNFHHETQQAYTRLADSVDNSLRISLNESLQLASKGIQPVVQTTMAHLAEQAHKVNEGLQHSLGLTLDTFNRILTQRSEALLETLKNAYSEQLLQQNQLNEQRLKLWSSELTTQTQTLTAQWQASGEQTLQQQQKLCETLTITTEQVSRQSHQQAVQTIAEINRLINVSEQLVDARVTAESNWATSHSQRTQALTDSLQKELQALRLAEEVRGQAAIERLAELQSAVTTHLATLGQALESPISRLIETASEAPKAAAQVIHQLRQEISISVARDNALLEERSRIMATLNQLLQSIDHASTEQRAVIENLVSASASALQNTSQHFLEHVQSETQKLSTLAAQVSAGSVEVASLGETFNFAVQTFAQANEQLMSRLQGIEAALNKSMTRSDEQLAYYVVQARELIEFSVGAQKDLLESLQKHATLATTAKGVA